jgi:hypothetical protein
MLHAQCNVDPLCLCGLRPQERPNTEPTEEHKSVSRKVAARRRRSQTRGAGRRSALGRAPLAPTCCGKSSCAAKNSALSSTQGRSVLSLLKLQNNHDRESFSRRGSLAVPKVFSGVLGVAARPTRGHVQPNAPNAPWHQYAGCMRGASTLARNGVVGSRLRAKCPLGRYREVPGSRMNTGWNRG